MRPDQVKQFRHHGGNTIEMSWPAGTFQLTAHVTRAHPYFWCALGVHFFHVGSEDDVHASRFQKLRIGLKRSGVIAVVIAIPKPGKLQRIYKNARNHHVIS